MYLCNQFIHQCLYWCWCWCWCWYWWYFTPRHWWQPMVFFQQQLYLLYFFCYLPFDKVEGNKLFKHRLHHLMIKSHHQLQLVHIVLLLFLILQSGLPLQRGPVPELCHFRPYVKREISMCLTFELKIIQESM